MQQSNVQNECLSTSSHVSSNTTPSVYPIKSHFINSSSQLSMSSFNFPTPVSNVDSPSLQDVLPSSDSPYTSPISASIGGSKRKNKKPVKSPSRAEETASSSSPGFVIQLGFGTKDSQILRLVNYERIPIRVNRPPVPSPYKSNGATKRQPRGLQTNNDHLVVKTSRRRQSFTALVSSPARPQSARILGSNGAIIESIVLPPSPLAETATVSPAAVLPQL